MRPQGALLWALPLVGTHAILLRGARWCQHTVRSSKEAAQLRLQVIPHLAHLQEKDRTMRWVVIRWRGQEDTHITFPHIPGSTIRAECRQITPILAMLTHPPKAQIDGL